MSSIQLQQIGSLSHQTIRGGIVGGQITIHRRAGVALTARTDRGQVALIARAREVYTERGHLVARKKEKSKAGRKTNAAARAKRKSSSFFYHPSCEPAAVSQIGDEEGRFVLQITGDGFQWKKGGVVLLLVRQLRNQ